MFDLPASALVLISFTIYPKQLQILKKRGDESMISNNAGTVYAY